MSELASGGLRLPMVRQVQSRPIRVEAVRVDLSNWETAKAITDWAHGRLHNGTRGTYLEVELLGEFEGVPTRYWSEVTSGWLIRLPSGGLQRISQIEFEKGFEFTDVFIVGGNEDVIEIRKES